MHKWREILVFGIDMKLIWKEKLFINFGKSRFRIKKMETRTFEELIADLTEFTGRKILLYVENKPDELSNNIITEDYNKIYNIIKKRDYELVYLPQLIKDPQILEGIAYFIPYYSRVKQAELIEYLYVSLIQHFNLKLEKGSLLGFSLDGRKVEFVYPVNERLSRSTEFLPQIRINYSKKYPGDVLKNNIQSDLSYILNEDEAVYDPGFSDNEDRDVLNNALLKQSDLFDEELQLREQPDPETLLLAKEILQKVDRLREIGGLQFLINLIEMQLQLETKISRLRVDKEYRIYLDDYQKEIKLEPLQKILYILYLEHPDGLNYNELIDYRQRLIQLYKNISQRENIDDMLVNINRLVDPLDNSINEKVSRIRSKFLLEIDESLAKPYLITGQRGDKRRILLDRSLVTIEYVAPVL